MKEPVCSICKGKHYQTFCPKKPRKPIKSKHFLPTSVKNKPTSAKKSPTSKKKPKSRSYYVKQLDNVFSQYIRLKDAIDGEARCVTCGDKKPWRQQQNGHYMSRGHLPTRWDETNCHVQCVACNVFKKGNYTEYALFMINRYGADYLEELKRKAKSGEKIPTPVIKDMIEEYTKKLLQFN